MFIIMFVDQKDNLNRTLVIDSPFQTFAVGRLVELIDIETLYTLSWSKQEVKVQHTSQ